MASGEAAISNEFEDNVVSGEQHGECKIDESVRVYSDDNEQTDSKMEQFSSWSEMCRVCANVNDHIVPIFEAEGEEHELSNKIHKYLPIRVHKTDTLPVQLCYHCASTILAWHELLEGCLDAEKRLLHLQAEQNSREEAQKKYSENLSFLSEELIDDPEPVVMEKQEPSSIEQQEEGSNYGDSSIDDEATKRSGTTRETTRFGTFLKKVTTHDVENTTTRKTRRTTRLDQRQRDDSFENKNTEKILEERNEEKKTIRFPCSKCSRVFKRETNLKRHAKNCENDHDTRIELENDVKISTKSNLSNNLENPHRETKSSIYTCMYCDFGTGKKKLLNLHTSEYHEKMSTSLLDKRQQEQQRNVDDDSISRAKMEANGRVYYHCEDCGKNLFSPYTFAWHMRIHTGERPFTCHLCGKQFRVNQGLARHLRETHEGIKNFACNLCGRMFSTKRNVDDHRRIHTGERPFVCNVCGKAFKQKASLFVHNRTHTDSFPFKCNYCNQGFRTRPPLVLHMTKHTGEKPHTCDICNRAFRIKYELKRHRLIHFDEKPWQCQDCDLAFRQKRYLVNHRRLNHGRDAKT